MPLSPGTRIGAYELAGPLGAGGMGEVYRARAAKLQRDVAIRILPHAFAYLFGAERKLFDWDVAREYAVGPAGDFYSMQPVPGAALQGSIQLWAGWFDEVARRVGR